MTVPTANIRLAGVRKLTLELDMRTMFNEGVSFPMDGVDAEVSFVFNCYEGV